jgi:GTP pyrophosphokinase
LDLELERRIEVTWDSEAKVEHAVKVNVHATDKPGLLAEMTRVFSELGVNIAQATCRVTGTGRAINTFQVQVTHLDHLKALMRALRRIKGVYSVDRL